MTSIDGATRDIAAEVREAGSIDIIELVVP